MVTFSVNYCFNIEYLADEYKITLQYIIPSMLITSQITGAQIYTNLTRNYGESSVKLLGVSDFDQNIHTYICISYTTLMRSKLGTSHNRDSCCMSFLMLDKTDSGISNNGIY